MQRPSGGMGQACEQSGAHRRDAMVPSCRRSVKLDTVSEQNGTKGKQTAESTARHRDGGAGD